MHPRPHPPSAVLSINPSRGFVASQMVTFNISVKNPFGTLMFESAATGHSFYTGSIYRKFKEVKKTWWAGFICMFPRLFRSSAI